MSVEIITTNKSNIIKNKLFLITYKTKDNRTRYCLYVALDYGILSMYANNTLSEEISDYSYIVKARYIANTLDLRKIGYTTEQAKDIFAQL